MGSNLREFVGGASLSSSSDPALQSKVLAAQAASTKAAAGSKGGNGSARSTGGDTGTGGVAAREEASAPPAVSVVGTELDQNNVLVGDWDVNYYGRANTMAGGNHHAGIVVNASHPLTLR